MDDQNKEPRKAKSKLSDEEVEIIRAYRELPPDERAAVLEWAEEQLRRRE